MKHFTVKWLKRLWVLIAVKLIIIAILITVVRFAISNVDNYKQLFFEWVAEEHGLHVDAEKISAGIDFSGLIITLNKVTFIDSKVLPFELKIDDLFLHFDFVESIKKQRVVFNDISIKGADLLVKSIPEDPDAIPYGSLGPEPQTQSDITLDALKNIFLLRVNSFVISDSSLRFTDHLHNQKKILIDELSWANNGKNHQGVGKATLPGFTKGDNNLTFIINLTGDAESSNDQLIGTLFINAENVDLSEYLTPQINPLADLKKSLVSFKLWGTFDFNGPKALQLSWGNSEIAWSLLDQTHHWQLNDGYMQFSYQKTKWLFDSYDLNLTHNLIPSNDINISGSGLVGRAGEFDLSGVNVNDIVPFGLLFYGLDETEIQRMNAFELGGQVTKLGLHFDQDEALNISIKMDYLNSQSVDDFPAINDATVLMSANQKGGHGRIQIGAQDINFNGQFNRVIPLKSADINLSWKNDQQGFEISSEESVIKTDDVDSTTQFSILFPAQETDISEPVSPLLTLYSIVSLNDGSKANHYYPIKIMGKEIYDYLQPTLKKGNIKDAKILWSGHFSDFPFQNNEGVFQAFVPITNAKYDFYPGWKGISDLDLVINFENDSLGMVSSKGKLGNVQLSELSADIDHLTEAGMLTINGEVNDNASLIADYLVDSPLKDSVGEAVNIFQMKGNLEGSLALNIPLLKANGDPQAKGQLTLKGNAIDIVLGDESLPLENVKGDFTFTNGDLKANNLTATLFKQPFNLSFTSEDLDDKYQLEANLFGVWDVTKLSQRYKALLPLKLTGNVEWQGQMNFMQPKGKDYQFALSLQSQLQGVKVNLPAPFNKSPLQTWATKVSASASPKGIQWVTSINNKLKSNGEVIYVKDKPKIKYLYLGLGKGDDLNINKNKQVIHINEDKFNLSPWFSVLKENFIDNKSTGNADSLIDIDSVSLDIKHAQLFEQPLVNLNAKMDKVNNKWTVNVQADELIASAEYRKGIPDRYDINISKLNARSFNTELLQAALYDEGDRLLEPGQNLRKQYPEIFLECIECNYTGMDLSPLKVHLFPDSVNYNIDYLIIGDEEHATTISGAWDQSHTNIIAHGAANSDNSIVKRLGYTSPIIFDNGEFNGAFNWVGAPWKFNSDSLNGSLKLALEDGLITEVDDKGARLLSFLSLDGIRRSLNLEFGNVFSKGLGFDKMSLSGTIKNGVFKNNDYFLDGSAGKVSGSGLIDLPNLNVNYRFSYSPAVTSSLPVLAAFAINPLTGAALLMLTEILEPVVDSIVRVDFSVKGSLMNPQVEIENRQRGTVKLQNSEVLEALEGQ